MLPVEVLLGQIAGKAEAHSTVDWVKAWFELPGGVVIVRDQQAHFDIDQTL